MPCYCLLHSLVDLDYGCLTICADDLYCGGYLCVIVAVVVVVVACFYYWYLFVIDLCLLLLGYCWPLLMWLFLICVFSECK